MWSPDPVRQREASYTIEDVLALPDDAHRFEFLDGVIYVVPSPTLDHQAIQFLVQRWLFDHGPSDLLVSAGLGVAVDLDQTLEPDVLITRRGISGTSHYFPADQVVVVVEIVSRSTKRRDRIEKPVDYAAAGIPHFWRVEQDPVHVFAYDLGPDGTYKLVADSDTELVLERPFAIRLPIGDITP
jgi:Uma2 family endonuclease